jgi:dihydroflavonol-4-reductase
LNLVTGATGLLGSHVVLKLLQQGKAVVAAKQEKSNTERVRKVFSYYVPNADELFARIKWVNIDVRDHFSIEDALDGIKAVYHCAGFVSFQNKDHEKLKQINEVGTANIVNACLEKNIEVLCLASSIATINNNDYLGQLSEKVFWKTSGKESSYAISKYNAEREVWRGIEEGLNAVIVNPGVILAPGFWDQSSGKLFDFCRKGNLFYTDGSTGYVTATDVAEVMVQLVDKKLYNERFIVNEGMYSYKTVFTLIQNEFDKQAPKIKSSKFLLHSGRIADGLLSRLTGKDRILTKDIINSALGHKDFSNQKIKNTLSFEFTPIPQAIKFIAGCLKKDLEKSKN